MFEAILKKRNASKEDRRAKKMAQLEKKAKNLFRRTAEDPNTVRRVLDARKGILPKKKKKYIKSSMAAALLSDDSVAPRALEDKKRRSRKLLYGETAEDGPKFKAGDKVGRCVCRGRGSSD